MTCIVGINIRSKPEMIHVPGTTRTFTPRVSGVVPARRMIWSDGFNPVFKGVRTFTLNPCC